MRTGAALLPALCALTLLPAGAQADAASCRDELRQMAQTYQLSLGPIAPNAQSQSAATAEAPATTESRGMTAGPDSLASSGGTLPPAASSAAGEPQSGTAPARQLGAADRAKLEGLLSEAKAADARGRADQCQDALRQAQAIVQKAGE